MSDEEKPTCPDCTDGKRHPVSSKTGETHTIRCHCTYKDLPIKVVLQPEKSGCGIAAVAMIVEKTYAEVRQYFDQTHDFTTQGMHMGQVEELLDVFGYAVQRRQQYCSRLGGGQRSPWPPEPWTDLHLAQVMNLPDTGWHFVVLLKDGRVLDPYWGVVQGLHRYPRVAQILGVFKVTA